MEDLNGLFEKENIKSDDFDIMINELASRHQKFVSNKNTDFSNDVFFQSILKMLDSHFDAAPPLKFIEDILKHYTRKKADIECYDIPTLLKSIGLVSCKTKDGSQITLKPQISFKAMSKMTEEEKNALFAWLKERGAGDLIKDNVQLGKGEFNAELEKFLNEKGYSYSISSDIAAQTLKSFFSKLIEGRRKGDNEELPPENVLKIEVFDVAKISK